MKYFLLAGTFLCFAGSLYAVDEASLSQPKNTENKKPAIGYIEQERTTTVQKQTVNENECGQYRRPLRVATFVTNPPLGWADVVEGAYSKNYTNAGFSIKYFTELAEQNNMYVKSVPFPSYMDAVKALNRGDIDVLAGAYYDPKIIRNNVAPIYPSYINNPFVVVFKKGKEKPVQNFDDLKGLNGLVREEELIYPLIYPSLPSGLSLKQISGATTAYTALLDESADYLLTGLYAAEAEIRRFKLMDDVVVGEQALTQPELFFVGNKSNHCEKAFETISNTLHAVQNNKADKQKKIIAEIDDWGKRFANEPSLPEQLAEQTNASSAQPVPKQ